SRRSGLLGLVRSFNYLKTSERLSHDKAEQKASRGLDARDTLVFHSLNGSVFEYILEALDPLSNGAKPLRAAIRALKRQASRLPAPVDPSNPFDPSVRAAVALNSRAIDLVDQFLTKAAG